MAYRMLLVDAEPNQTVADIKTETPPPPVGVVFEVGNRRKEVTRVEWRLMDGEAVVVVFLAEVPTGQTEVMLL